MYFPQVINNVYSTYQQVCDVKLAFIGAQNNDCFSDCCRRSYRMTAQSITKKQHHLLNYYSRIILIF